MTTAPANITGPIRWRRPSDAVELRDFLASANEAKPENGYIIDALHKYTELAAAMEADLFCESR